MATVCIFAIFLAIFVSCTQSVTHDDSLHGTFPHGFLWGAAASAYQVEGAWNLEGKGESIWDRFCHFSGKIYNNDTGDIACDSYYQYNEDIELLKNLKVDFYRFSISWSRILHFNGVVATENEEGVAHYNGMIKALKAAGIEPMVTLYHFDLPQALQDIGGWQNESMVHYFNDYARLCFQRFGQNVKWWITFNEPWTFGYFGYGLGIFAPGISSLDVGPYQVGHIVLKAHAEAWHTYDKDFRKHQKGKISITLGVNWHEPFSNSSDDIKAAERAMQFDLGWFAHPIFVNGDYPEVMKSNVATKSELEGRNQSRLPEFTEKEKRRIKGTHDFIGLNHYTTLLAKNFPTGPVQPGWDSDRDVEDVIDPSWPSCGVNWLKIVPWGMRKMLRWVKESYGNPRVIITENGVADDLGVNDTLADTIRINYIRDYVNEMLKAIKHDDCHVGGYTVWSLMDNFEWSYGYGIKFGLYHVDFNNPSRPRTAKKSVTYYKKMIHGNSLPSE